MSLVLVLGMSEEQRLAFYRLLLEATLRKGEKRRGESNPVCLLRGVSMPLEAIKTFSGTDRTLWRETLEGASRLAF